MKSLFKSITSRSNSTSNNDNEATPSTLRTSPVTPVLPPIATGVSILPISNHTPSIPIPNIRRASEPISSERWARPNLPSYAVSRAIPEHDNNNRALPDYQDVISSPTSSRLQSRDDSSFVNQATREYFGTSSTSQTNNPFRTSSPIEETAQEDSSEENGTSSENQTSEDVFSDHREAQTQREDGDQDQVLDEGFEEDNDDDDPLIPRRRILDPQTARRNTFTATDRPRPRRPTLSSGLSSSLGRTDSNADRGLTSLLGEGYIDLPIPTSDPPIYSPSLGRDELRLISSVHLSADHPASAYFNEIAQSPPPPSGPIPSSSLANLENNNNSDNSNTISSMNTSAGNKKLRVNITRGAKRLNLNGTGPLYIKLAREEWVEGIINVGKVDRAVTLEVAIIGMINVSYYVRGQYTVLDTLPMARNKIQLFPRPTETTTFGHSEQLSNHSNGQNLSANTPLDSQPSSTSNLIPPPTQATLVGPLLTKDGQPLLPPNTSFSFALQMPNTHFRDANSELPPSCDLQQVGMQANVEYVLRVKLVRKGLRFNETVTVPIFYAPRAYIPPRRIRSLTFDDPLNPGWRSIELNGGKPKSKSELPSPLNANSNQGPGIDVTLLLPSPPILFIPSDPDSELPSFPFHLHFHSTLPHVLSTFANPQNSKFVVRLTRVTIFRIGLEKEIRRIEVPTKSKVWQEGGDQIELGIDGMINDTNSPNGRRGSTASNATSRGRRGSLLGDNNSNNNNNTSSQDNALSSSVPTSSNMRGGSETESGGNEGPGGPLRRFSSAGTTSTPGVNPESPRKKSFLGDRRGSFSLRRRNSNSSQSSTAGGSNLSIGGGQANMNSNVLSPTISNLPPIIDEDDNSPTNNENQSEVHGVSTSAFGGSSIVPVDMTSTDVHLKGSIQIKPLISSSVQVDLIRKLMIQSFIVPEMTLTYVLEVGIEPKKGSVRENFTHVWGGGVVEVVLGRRS
ncbi:uncharacterized protein L201_004778 [Kwoniella dendrophila CBS 6074]|uniref:Arrestin C-terminal-like domain-containing protein n=1 Tax=Kwoniella dendrophila CBS 6074 TaxID=1295534 RepID=A0AAX4JZ70_9TREE